MIDVSILLAYCVVSTGWKYTKFLLNEESRKSRWHSFRSESSHFCFLGRMLWLSIDSVEVLLGSTAVGSPWWGVHSKECRQKSTTSLYIESE